MGMPGLGPERGIRPLTLRSPLKATYNCSPRNKQINTVRTKLENWVRQSVSVGACFIVLLVLLLCACFMCEQAVCWTGRARQGPPRARFARTLPSSSLPYMGWPIDTTVVYVYIKIFGGTSIRAYVHAHGTGPQARGATPELRRVTDTATSTSHAHDLILIICICMYLNYLAAPAAHAV